MRWMVRALVMLLTFGLGIVGPLGRRQMTARYDRAVRQSKESQLRSDLFTLRSSIRRYTEAHGNPPRSLEELVLAGYISEVPRDPFTGAPYRGIVYVAESRAIEDSSAAPIATVVSASEAMSTEGTPYSTW